MKHLLRVSVLALLVCGSMHADQESSKTSLVDKVAGIYYGAKNKVQAYHASLLADGLIRRMHSKIPRFLKGDSAVDSVARIGLLGCGLYLGIKPLLKNDSGAQKVVLGLLGFVFKMFGIENLTVRGTNVAELANQKRQELSQDVSATMEKFAQGSA